PEPAPRRPGRHPPALPAGAGARDEPGTARASHPRRVPGRRDRLQQDPGPALQGVRDREPVLEASRQGEPRVSAPEPKLGKKDFVSDQDVRWCPGCGDYAVLSQVQKVLPELGVARENFVFSSGIGYSNRFPYYVNTYGCHSLHARAPATATGLKRTRPVPTV